MRDIYVYFYGPDIKGDSQDELNTDAIEIESWSEAQSMPTSDTRSASGSATIGKPNFSDFNFTKLYDSSSVLLMQNFIKGTEFQKVVLKCYRAYKDQRVCFLEVTMTESIISNYSFSAGSGGFPVENLSIDYGTIEYKYTDTDKKTGAATQPKTIKYSRITNAKV